MALCRRCRVREESFMCEGLCRRCYGDREQERRSAAERDRESRQERERQERREYERSREERESRERSAQEERRHNERLEELREEEVEYQRQAAEDAADAARDAAEAKRLAGLKRFTCSHCEATFNEEQGVSAIKSPTGKPLCSECLKEYVQCDFCKKNYWADNIPVMRLGEKNICFGCQNTQARDFIEKQRGSAKK